MNVGPSSNDFFVCKIVMSFFIKGFRGSKLDGLKGDTLTFLNTIFLYYFIGAFLTAGFTTIGS